MAKKKAAAKKDPKPKAPKAAKPKKPAATVPADQLVPVLAGQQSLFTEGGQDDAAPPKKTRKPKAPKLSPASVETSAALAEVIAPAPRPLLMLDRPGYYEAIDIRDYARDPWAEPSLSKGVVHDLFYGTPNRAHGHHPRFGAASRKDNRKRTAFGSASHSLIQGNGAAVVYAPAEFQNWKKKDAQVFRNEATARGEIAMLDCDKQKLADVVGKVRELLASEFGQIVANEITMLWQRDVGGGKVVNCRARTDILTAGADVDLKSFGAAFNPKDWKNFAAVKGGYDIQAAMRHEAHQILGQPRTMHWLIYEEKAPNDMCVIDIAESMLDVGRRKLDLAAPLWRQNLDAKLERWPSWSRQLMQAPARSEFDLADRGETHPSEDDEDMDDSFGDDEESDEAQ